MVSDNFLVGGSKVSVDFGVKSWVRKLANCFLLVEVGGQTEKTCIDFRENLISTKVIASHRKSTQVHARPGQTESQVDPSFQLATTCESV